jgi:hypothetical protein
MLHPEVQQKIHEEIDEQLGEDRSFRTDQIEKLLYLNAAWKESMRLNPTVPLGRSSSTYCITGAHVHVQASRIAISKQVFGMDIIFRKGRSFMRMSGMAETFIPFDYISYRLDTYYEIQKYGEMMRNVIIPIGFFPNLTQTQRACWTR